MLLELFIDVFSKSLVAGQNSISKFQLPALFQGDTIDLKLTFLKPTGQFATQYQIVSLQDTDLRVAIGGKPVGNVSGPTPLAYQDIWVIDPSNDFATGSLSLNTSEIEEYIGTGSERAAYFEIETLKDAKYDTVLQTGCLLKAEVIENPAFPPSANPGGGFGGNMIGSPGESITLRSPNGNFSVIIYVDDTGNLHMDNSP